MGEGDKGGEGNTASELPYALLRYSTPEGRCRWLQGRSPVRIVQARTHAEVLPALRQVEQATRAGLYAVGFVSYEAAHGFDTAFPATPSTYPLAWFGLYRQLQETTAQSADAGLIHRLCWQPTLCQSAYDHAVERIRELIGAGDVYQVNYSFRLRAPFEGDPLALFWQLYNAQPVPYAAYIDTGELAILSLSPELFFALEGERIISRPMKGTAPRGMTLEDDTRRAQALHGSEKNRAENLMIVDMVRNDLGRIAKVGSVRVPRLFETERYATLWQMTSTVEARTDAPLCAIFRALFPPASVTGAPKIRATQVIHELETTPRGVYTGAIGVILPERKAQFNVAIRTLVYHRDGAQLEYGVGSGVVWDSETQAEYQECLTKAQIVLSPRPEFALLETLLWRPCRGYFLLERHLRRLQRSADYFGFPLDVAAVREQLLCVAQTRLSVQNRSDACATGRAFRVRLLVDRHGTARLEYAPLEPTPKVWRVALAPEPIDPHDVFLYHKTTRREVYERARAARPNCDDVILWNPRGAITESTVANVVVNLNGRLYTPPTECGLLGGVYREHLIERGKLQERVITIQELQHAKALYLINSVRGWIKALFLSPSSPAFRSEGNGDAVPSLPTA
ncbi:MAG: aminodeoxychorismate synthase component I [Fimbriimonadales bacterium]|nr:aminodeoxychorismate synthase component I [Fimbriimonadales bacterium]